MAKTTAYLAVSFPDEIHQPEIIGGFPGVDAARDHLIALCKARYGDLLKDPTDTDAVLAQVDEMGPDPFYWLIADRMSTHEERPADEPPQAAEAASPKPAA